MHFAEKHTHLGEWSVSNELRQSTEIHRWVGHTLLENESHWQSLMACELQERDVVMWRDGRGKRRGSRDEGGAERLAER
jgi:hypothetical protein